MFLSSKFYIHKENDQLIEFREKRWKLFSGSLLSIGFGFVCLFPFFKEPRYCSEIGLWKSFFLIGFGTFCILLGLIPMLSTGKIVINRDNKSLLFYGGVRKYLFSPIKISFSEISHIEIQEAVMARYGFKGVWDIIILKLNMVARTWKLTILATIIM